MVPLGIRFPAGEASLHRALRRRHLRPEDVEARLLYTGVSQSLHISCPRLGLRTSIQLPPEDLRADTAWGEMCEELAEELSRRERRARVLSEG